MARRKRTSRRGAALVEFALVGALLCVLLFGIVEVGLIFGDQTQVGAAAREARPLPVGRRDHSNGPHSCHSRRRRPVVVCDDCGTGKQP